MIIMLEDVARTKMCPRIVSDCHGSGCMAWRDVEFETQVAEVPWPDEIERPRLDFQSPLNMGRTHKELAAELRDLAIAALRPLVGRLHEQDWTIGQAIPSDYRLQTVRLQLRGPRRGGCTFIGAERKPEAI